MKKRWLALLWLLYALIAPGCTPYLTYDELHDAHEAATTQEEKDDIMERIERFERDAERANAYFENRAHCAHTSDYVWYCSNPIMSDERVDALLTKTPPLTMEERVKLYRRLKSSCGCVSRDELLRNLF